MNIIYKIISLINMKNKLTSSRETESVDPLKNILVLSGQWIRVKCPNYPLNKDFCFFDKLTN